MWPGVLDEQSVAEMLDVRSLGLESSVEEITACNGKMGPKGSQKLGVSECY